MVKSSVKLTPDEVVELFSKEEDQVDLIFQGAGGNLPLQLHHPTDADMLRMFHLQQRMRAALDDEEAVLDADVDEEEIMRRRFTRVSFDAAMSIMLTACSPLKTVKACSRYIGSITPTEQTDLYQRITQLVGRAEESVSPEEGEEPDGGSEGNE